jgi:hypothetical protein
MKTSRKLLTLGLASALLFAPLAAQAEGYQHFHRHHKMKAPPPPKGTHIGNKIPAWAYYASFAGGCTVIWLMLASTKKGGLTPLEAKMIFGNCFLPFVGGEIMKAIHLKNNPV